MRWVLLFLFVYLHLSDLVLPLLSASVFLLVLTVAAALG
jgi:hypothetical protein